MYVVSPTRLTHSVISLRFFYFHYLYISFVHIHASSSHDPYLFCFSLLCLYILFFTSFDFTFINTTLISYAIHLFVFSWPKILHPVNHSISLAFCFLRNVVPYFLPHILLHIFYQKVYHCFHIRSSTSLYA